MKLLIIFSLALSFGTYEFQAEPEIIPHENSVMFSKKLKKVAEHICILDGTGDIVGNGNDCINGAGACKLNPCPTGTVEIE